jgi:flagellar biosynthesis protein
LTRPPIRRGTPPHDDDPPRAVALQYQRQRDPAPKIVAKGEGDLALKILELAREHGIAIKEDPDLAQLLSAAELETQIPVEAFVAVAEILSFIYRAKAQGPTAQPPAPGTIPR